MIDDVEKQIYEVASKFAFVEKAETLLKTPNTIKIKLPITSNYFSMCAYLFFGFDNFQSQ
jgi:hypothetical protein